MNDSNSHARFLDLDPAYCDPTASSNVILPVPFERTTSYRRGTAEGPAAILEASKNVELFDEELFSEPFRSGIITLEPLQDHGATASAYLSELRREIVPYLAQGRFVICLGGEHTLTQAPVRAAKEVFGDVGVVQFDAHADLRDTYDDTPYSHACVMRRIVEMEVPYLGIGIRSLSEEEAPLIDRSSIEMIWGRELQDLTTERLRDGLRRLPDKIYLTFDVDFFDPSLIPATGTPEPGGGRWWPTLELLRQLFREKEVVAMDLVELSPIPGQPASDFTVARLAYKCIGYHGDSPRSEEL